MFRRQNFLQTGKYPKIEHIFSSRKHTVFRSYEKGTQESFLTKRIIIKGETMMDYYKYHMYERVIPYIMKEKFGQGSMLRLSPQNGQVMIQGKYQEDQTLDYQNSDSQNNENNMTEIDGSTLFISKKLIPGKSLKQMVIRKDERLNNDFLKDLVGTTVDFILSNGGVKDLLITSDNIIVEDCGLIHLNYFSLVGIDFFRLDRYINKEEFQEMLPYLTTQFILEQKNCKITLEMELKFIMINFYSAFFKRDLIFDPKFLNLQVEVKKNDGKVLQIIQKVEQTLMSQLFPKQLKIEVAKFDQINKVKYTRLLSLFMRGNQEDQNEKPIDKNQKKKMLNWQYILESLSPRVQNGDKSDLAIDQKEEVRSFETYTLINNQDRFSFNLMQMVDVYITLINLLIKDVNFQQIEGTQRSKYEKLRKSAQLLNNQRQNWIQESRYQRSLYIPLKTGMKFCQILKYRSWVNMLHTASEATSSTLDSITKLLQFTLQIRQNMTTIEPLITRTKILNVISLRTYNPKLAHKSFYGFLKFISKQRYIQQQKMDNYNASETDVKNQFWNSFFWLLNGLNILAKKYFMTVTNHKHSKIKLNRQDFNSIIKQIDETVPLLSAIVELTGSILSPI